MRKKDRQKERWKESKNTDTHKNKSGTREENGISDREHVACAYYVGRGGLLVVSFLVVLFRCSLFVFGCSFRFCCGPLPFLSFSRSPRFRCSFPSLLLLLLLFHLLLLLIIIFFLFLRSSDFVCWFRVDSRVPHRKLLERTQSLPSFTWFYPVYSVLPSFT